ncbi:MAG TPA: hypothetical protein DEF61_00880 [Firmicutes bacterium]|nr:hypothetical protein [Bacillota bacterium]HBX24838.1 hypothetical protein [Bacillota bacterium]
MNDSVAELIKQSHKQATPSEKRMGKKLLSLNMDEVVYMSITELSEKISSSEATILRYCRKLGFKGFQDFKLAISRDLALKEKEADLSPTSFFLSNISKALEKEAESIDEEDIEIVSNKLLSSRKIAAFGVGSSHVAPTFLKQRLLAVGKYVMAEESSHSMAAIASNLSNKDICILFSVTGSTKDILDAARLAKANSAYIVSITSYPSSPLGKLSDIILSSCTKEAAPYRGGVTQTMGQLFIAGLISEKCYSMLGKEGEKIASKTISNFSDKLI